MSRENAGEAWEVSIGHDARGYPTFYINGLSGDEKRDTEALADKARLIAAAPCLLEALRETKELLRFALLSTTPEIAKDAMVFIRQAEAIPARVRVRVFTRHGGRCHLSGRLIRAGDQWDCDHVVALINGGEHREFNLAPALREIHREKTADDVAVKSKTARVRAKHLGVFPRSKVKIASRGFQKSRAYQAGSEG